MTVKLLVQTIIYGLITLFGLFIAIPIAVTSNKLNGYCLLYGNGVWRQHGIGVKFEISVPELSAVGMCQFNIYFHVVATILFAGGMEAAYIYMFVSSIRGNTKKIPPALEIVSLVVNSICLLITLVSGCLLAAGFNSWCSSLVAGPDKDCADTQTSVNWKEKEMDGSTFHTCYIMAIICCWLVTFLWGIIVGIGAFPFIKKYRNRRRAARESDNAQPRSSQNSLRNKEPSKQPTSSTKPVASSNTTVTKQTVTTISKPSGATSPMVTSPRASTKSRSSNAQPSTNPFEGSKNGSRNSSRNVSKENVRY